MLLLVWSGLLLVLERLTLVLVLALVLALLSARLVRVRGAGSDSGSEHARFVHCGSLKSLSAAVDAGSEDSQGSAGQGQGVGMVALALVEGDRPGRRGCPPSSLSAGAGYMWSGAVCAPAMQGPLGGPGTGIV